MNYISNLPYSKKTYFLGILISLIFGSILFSICSFLVKIVENKLKKKLDKVFKKILILVFFIIFLALIFLIFTKDFIINYYF